MNARIISTTKSFEPYTLENIINIVYQDGVLVITMADEEGLLTTSYTEKVTVAITQE